MHKGTRHKGTSYDYRASFLGFMIIIGCVVHTPFTFYQFDLEFYDRSYWNSLNQSTFYLYTCITILTVENPMYSTPHDTRLRKVEFRHQNDDFGIIITMSTFTFADYERFVVCDTVVVFITKWLIVEFEIEWATPVSINPKVFFFFFFFYVEDRYMALCILHFNFVSISASVK